MILAAFFVLASSLADVSPSSLLPWARDRESLVCAQTGGVLRVRHTGTRDWALRLPESTDVRPGDAFEIVSDVSWTGQTAVASSVELFDARGKVLHYLYAYKPLPEAGVFTNRFVIPPGTAKVLARLNGGNVGAATVRRFAIARTGHRDFTSAQDRALENDRVRVVVRGRDGSPEVTDRRTGRTWTPQTAESLVGAFVTEAPAKTPGAVAVEVFDAAKGFSFRAEYVLEPSGELSVTLEGEGPLADPSRPYAFPAPFGTRKGDRLIVPMNEGMGYPADEPQEGLGRLFGWSGHGLCMAFFGVVEEASGAGWMAILETPDDGLAQAVWNREAGRWTLGPRWVDSLGAFRYPRRLRYVFLDRGGHVAMCKRYRAYAKESGKFKSFREKTGARPNVDRLLGAANVWCWDRRPLEIVKELVDAGIDRFVWSAGGKPEDVKAIAAMPNLLVSRYDNYQDVPTPELVKEGIRRDPGPIGCAWPDDIAWLTPTGGLAKAWGARTKDGRWVHFARMCDRRAPDHARRCLREELPVKPYTCRFIDTTVASPWYECRNPAHPMSRSDSRRWKMELLRLMGDEFGLVTGSETGHDASVPYCDYYEGMMSVGPYRAPDAGRRMQEVWTNAPAKTVKYMVGEKYRLPLWELVYHDCVCAHWYWGDHVGKMPEIWRKRDLFNVLYGTMGLYMFDRAMWRADRDRYVRSFRTTSPVARATGYSEMLDHVYLTADKSVQRTVFADGTTVTVNFGERPFRLEDGSTLPPMDSCVTKAPVHLPFGAKF